MSTATIHALVHHILTAMAAQKVITFQENGHTITQLHVRHALLAA